MLKILPKLGIRFLTSIITFLIIISLIFFALQLAPGESSYKYISSDLSSEAIKHIIENFKPNANIWEQYTAFLTNILQFDFGFSLNYRSPVIDVIAPKFLFTLLFTFCAFVFQLAISFVLAYLSAKNPFTRFDNFIKTITLISYSTPPFVSGLILIFIFAYALNLFPLSGAFSIGFEQLSFTNKIFDIIKHLTLPIIVFTLIQLPIYYNYLRESLKEIVSSTFIIYLRSIGTKESIIFWKHILPNAVSSVIAIAGVEIGVMLGGSLIIEVVFGLPGMGRLIVSAISANDYPLVLGCCFIASSLVIAVGFFSDLIRVLLDKRLAKGLLN